MIDFIFRVLNGIRKVAAGLRPFSESVWPGVRDDLFVAHESIYVFAQRLAARQDVLDAGCGTGYGSFLLAKSGAASVLGVDLDRRNIAFARRRYEADNLAFQVADLECLNLPEQSFGFVIASNSLEHLSKPHVFLRMLGRILQPDGSALVVVPPIYTYDDVRTHLGIHYHRSNLPVAEWLRLFAEAGFAASAIRHWADPLPNFYSRRPSKLRATNFTFTPVGVERLLQELSIGAIFVLKLRAA